MTNKQKTDLRTAKEWLEDTRNRWIELHHNRPVILHCLVSSGNTATTALAQIKEQMNLVFAEYQKAFRAFWTLHDELVMQQGF